MYMPYADDSVKMIVVQLIKFAVEVQKQASCRGRILTSK